MGIPVCSDPIVYPHCARRIESHNEKSDRHSIVKYPMRSPIKFSCRSDNPYDALIAVDIAKRA